MTESLSNNLIKRDKNNAISNYRESANCNLGLLVLSPLPVCQSALQLQTQNFHPSSTRALQALSVCFYSRLHHQQLWIGKFILCMQQIHMKMLKLTYESLVLWQSTVPSGSHCGKDRLEGGQLQKYWTMVRSVKLVLSVKRVKINMKHKGNLWKEGRKYWT